MRLNVVFIVLGKLLLYYIVITDSNLDKPTSIPEYPNIKYCSTTIDAASGEQRSTYQSLKEELDHNCTHVYGDIVLTSIYKKANGEDPDLRFLSSIREVVGSIKIFNTNVSRIPLTSLQVIRGQDVHKKSISQEINALNFFTTNNVKYQVVMDFRNLTSISSGSIFISPAYCSSLTNINWNFIVTHRSFQKVEVKCVNSSTFQCSNKCPLIKNKRYCWGPRSDQCQKVTKCQRRQCIGRCFISKSGEEECCNTACLGGCTSIASSTCFACKGVLNSTRCIDKCPYKKMIDRQSDQTVNNKYFRFRYRHICVKQCPNNLVEENGECKTHCENKNSQRENNTCVKCKKYCKKTCHETDIFSPTELREELTSMNKKTLQKLANCTSYKGILYFGTESFKSKYPITSFRDLVTLQSLQVIHGHIYLEFSAAKFPIRNLSFLGNLEKIYKSRSHIANEISIFSTQLEFLGLNKLNHLFPKAKIYLENNPKLCYFDETTFKARFPESLLKIKSNAYSKTCEKEGKTCDDQCDSKYGCWGPGPRQCRICRNRSLGDLCATDCLSIPGYYKNKTKPTSKMNDIPSLMSDRKCLKCHKQCLETCNGPSSRDCLGKCRKYKEGNNCVEICSSTYYLDSNSSQCLPCSQACHMREETMKPVCTGPSDQPGSGGCNKCTALMIKNNTAYCTKLKVAPPGFYRKNEEFYPQTKFSRYFETLPDIYVTFRPCHKLCTRCQSAGPERIKNTGCQECRGFWLENTCVETCPEKTTYLIDLKSNKSKGLCGRCHSECIGCTGRNEMDCMRCRNYQMLLNHSRVAFTCLKNCPSKYKGEEKNGTKQCIYVRMGTMEMLFGITLVVCFFILAFLIAIIVKIRGNIRFRRRGNKMKAFFSNANETASPHHERTEIRYLPIIQSDNINYKKEDLIGSGAFGAVYRGFWEPGDDYFDDNASLNSCKNQKTEVAIKILKDFKQDEFMDEVKIMASVRHRHCLRLIGVCYYENQPLLLTSYLSLGSMDKYLQNHKSSLTASDLLTWVEQIASGMLYLSKNHIIHRDLATRNVLINRLDLVQITDFGLAMITKEETITVCSGIVPVRWLAIEALQKGIYSHQTDVWAFGVTVWEILSFAKTPYEDIKAIEICQEISKGTRLRQPDICSLEIYIILLKCWCVNAVDRPTFEYLWTEFKKFSTNPYVYLSHPNNEDRDSERNSSRKYFRSSNIALERNGSITDPAELELMLMNSDVKRNINYHPATSFNLSTSSFSNASSPSIIYKNIIPSHLSTEYLEPNNNSSQSYRNTER